MSSPILRSQPCPETMLPGSALTFLRLAQTKGWDAYATVAVGPPDDLDLAVMSVVVWARRSGVHVDARWECPSDRSRPFGFAAAWRTPGVLGWPDRLNFTEAKAALKGE